MDWSDGRERGANFEGTELARAIRQYFEEPLDEEILRLRWDNEYLRKLLRERDAPIAQGAAAGD